MRVAHFPLVLFASLTLMLLAASTAPAAIISRNVQFTAADMHVFAGPGPAPVDPVIGEFVISLDPSVYYEDNTANISLVSLNIALSSTLAFSYEPADSGSGHAGRLRVGGIAAGDALGTGADRVQYTPPTNDFWLYIDDFATSPTFLQLGYSQAGTGPRLWGTLVDETTSSINVTPVSAAAVPEPTSLAVFGMGMAATLLGSRRKKKAHTS